MDKHILFQAYQQQSRINKNQNEDELKIKVPGLKALKLSTKNLGNDFIQKKKYKPTTHITGYRETIIQNERW